MESKYQPEEKTVEELVETYDGHTPRLEATQEQLESEKYEKAAEVIGFQKTSPSEEELVDVKKKIESAFEKQDEKTIKTIAQSKKPILVPRGVSSKGGFLKKTKTWLLGLTALGLSTAATGQTKQTEKDPQTKGKIEVYTKANTPEGGITPTGLSNSFLENKYGVTTDDIYTVAKHYGFSTENEAAFQKDMFDYVKEKKPEVLDALFQEFGPTNYGKVNNMSATDFMQYYDKILGARGAKVISILKEEMGPKKQPEIYSEFASRGKPIFDRNGHSVGELCYPTRQTDDIKNAGNLNTSEVEAVLREKDEFGVFTGKVMPFTEKDITRLFRGTDHFQDPEASEYIELVKSREREREKQRQADAVVKNKK